MDSMNLQQLFNAGKIIEFNKPTVVLASASPRRARLLSDASIDFVQIVSTVDDTILNQKFPHDGITKAMATNYAKAMALAKLQPFKGKIVNGVVITADTCIYCDGRILEKPLTIEKCRAQHAFISGKTNINLTAYAVYYNGKVLAAVMPTNVFVKELPNDVIEVICIEPEILDCAGYRNQGQINPYLVFDKTETDNLTGLHVPFVQKMLNKLGFSI